MMQKSSAELLYLPELGNSKNLLCLCASFLTRKNKRQVAPKTMIPTGTPAMADIWRTGEVTFVEANCPDCSTMVKYVVSEKAMAFYLARYPGQPYLCPHHRLAHDPQAALYGAETKEA